MTKDLAIRIGALKKTEWAEADRIVRLAFSTFLGLPNPTEFMGDRQFVISRARSKHVDALAARDGGKLIGINLVTHWGSFGFFGPLSVLPEYWDRGVAQKLLESTLKIFDARGTRHTGLFTFAQSTKHVGLYQKFGYWPQHLTAVLTRIPPVTLSKVTLISEMSKTAQAKAIKECAQVTDRISKGLDLTGEIRTVLELGLGDIVLVETRGVVEGFAICMHGAGTEGGKQICYVKFGAVRAGAGAEKRFDRLLDGCESYAAEHGATVEAGVNLARAEAFRHMRSRGYRVTSQGVAMQRPHVEGFNRLSCWVMDDWR
jgi:GNAT superfamily N-acetyltransferase